MQVREKLKKKQYTSEKSRSFFLHLLGNNRIQRWLPGATSGDTIFGTGVSGAASNQLSYPEQLLFDKNYNLLVVDRSNNRVQLINLTVC